MHVVGQEGRGELTSGGAGEDEGEERRRAAARERPAWWKGRGAQPGGEGAEDVDGREGPSRGGDGERRAARRRRRRGEAAWRRGSRSAAVGKLLLQVLLIYQGTFSTGLYHKPVLNISNFR